MAVIILKNAKGIVIPEKLMKKLGVKKGDKLIVDIDEKGELVIRKYVNDIIDKSFGIWHDDFDPNLDSTVIVDRIRKAWERNLKE